MHRVLAHEPVGNGVRGIDPDAHVLHVQRPAPRVQVLDDTPQQPLVVPRVVALEVVLPPDLALDLRPRHREGVVDRPAGAGWVGVEDERAVDTEAGGKALAIRVRAAEANAAPIVGDGVLEQTRLGQVVPEIDPLQPELALQRGFQLHDTDCPRAARIDASPSGLIVTGLSEGRKVGGKREYGAGAASGNRAGPRLQGRFTLE